MKENIERIAACLDCGGTLRSSRETERYTLAGGWSVTLKGVEILRCRRCGYREVVIEKPLVLHRTIAAAVVRKHGRLAAQEIAFLRTHLDLSGRDLARALGVTPSSLSRWEQEREPIGAVPDRLLRALVMLKDRSAQHDNFAIETFTEIGGSSAPVRLTVRMDGQGNWKVAA